MKKFFYVICCILCASIFVFSCSSDDFDGVSPDKHGGQLNMPDQYKEVGVMHNKSLDYAFESIKKCYQQIGTKGGVLKTKLSKENYLAIGEQGLKDFCFENLKNYTVEFHEELTRNMKVVNTKSGTSGISDGVLELIQEMNSLLEKVPASPAALLKGLNRINEEAADRLSESDAAAIYAGTSTCYNSYLYWRENYMKWVIALNYPELLNQYSGHELNRFTMKDGKLISPVAMAATKSADDTTSSWLDDLWDGTKEVWDSVDDAVTDWWNNGGGKEVVASDAGSAAVGAISTAVATGGAGAAVGGLVGGAAGSIGTAIEEFITGD